MTWPLEDNFADPRGRWDAFAPYDATEYYDNVKSFLTTQQHVDIRTFRVVPEFVPRPQSDLEATTQKAWESPVVQQTMEVKPGPPITEAWVLAGTGLSSPTLGPIAARGGWPGMQLTATGVPINATLTSTFAKLDLSAQDNLSLILPDYNSFDGASYIQFTSDTGGRFGTDGWGIDHWGAPWGSPSTASYDVFTSAIVPFSSNIGAMPQLLLPLSDFTSGAGASFNLAAVTGVRIGLVKATAPARNTVVTLMALRALNSAWTESALDFDTELGTLCVPVTLTGSSYAGTVAKNFEFIRGDGSQNDPIPVDGAYNVFFYAGGQTSPNDATGSNYNNLDILVRENKNTGAGTGSFIVARLKWKDTATVFEAQRIDMTGGAGGTRSTTTLHTQTVGGALSTTNHYLFRVEITGTQVIGKLYTAQFDGTPGSLVWTSTPVSTSDFIWRNGRVGFMAGLLTRDAYVTQWAAATTGYATLITQPYTTYTPVDGAQLAAQYAADANLFGEFTGPDLIIDPTKTVSGVGSWSATQSITSNQFIIDDWLQTYLSCAIWVGPAATLSNQPQIVLNTPTSTANIRIGKLYPNQWNYVLADLAAFRSLLTGVGYSITIQPNTDPDRALGQFWVDKMTVGRRRVAWEFRASSNGAWRQFGSMANSSTGAVHLNPGERGILPQLQARALTQDAWIAIAGGPKLVLHFAPLGNPVYDSAAGRSNSGAGWGLDKWGKTFWGA